MNTDPTGKFAQFIGLNLATNLNSGTCLPAFQPPTPLPSSCDQCRLEYQQYVPNIPGSISVDEFCAGVCLPTTPPQIVYFGGSAGGPNADTSTMTYGNTTEPFIIGQAPFLAGAADVLVPYPGTPSAGLNGEIGKELQALNASTQVSNGSSVISLGYSAGADGALIFTYRYRDRFNMIGVGILGGNLDANINNNADGLVKLDQMTSSGSIQWQEMITELLSDGIRVYILDDNVPQPDFASYVASQPSNPNLCYVPSSLNHFGDVDEGTQHTNRDSSVPTSALAFLQNGDRSGCR